jgi:uncharacterized protein
LSRQRFIERLHVKEGYPDPWKMLTEKYPEMVAGSSAKFMTWKLTDPEKWVPDGYAVVCVDSREQAGRRLSWRSVARETKDFYDCIEWAARQSWCDGKGG